MFTGLIQTIAQISQVVDTPDGSRLLTLTPKLKPEAQSDFETFTTGESIAINGACMTVTEHQHACFSCLVSPESLAKTTLGTLQPGDIVNLERPLTPVSLVGGHFVTGHVDCTGTIEQLRPWGDCWVLRVRVNDPQQMIYLVEKGSIAIDGVSLTVNTIIQDVFSVCLIPHTVQETHFQVKQAGDVVNLETDLLGKYAIRSLSFRQDELCGIPKPGPAQNDSVASTSKIQASHQRIFSGNWFNHDTLRGEDIYGYRNSPGPGAR
jgi:riboflavin synthase